MSSVLSTFTHKATPILRRSLQLKSNIPTDAFILPCKKIIFEYCEVWGSNKGMKEFLIKDVVKLAKQYPGVELVVRRKENSHPHLKGIYVNNKDKVICVRNLPPTGILAKVQLLLDSSGSKIVTLKRPKVESRTESVRGIWSAFHE